MFRRIPVSVIVLMLLVLSGIAFYFRDTPVVEPEPVIESTEPEADAAALASPSSSVDDDPLPALIDANDKDIDDLQLALQAATQMRQTAELKLLDIEQELESLEQFVEAIEDRGEDPTDFADDGLEQFQPLFFRYQDAFAEFEQAEAIEQAAIDALREVGVEPVLRDDGGDP
ncbi:MAG: hypothetical protein AAF270_03095 [Pseudomonadota bacterium]